MHLRSVAIRLAALALLPLLASCGQSDSTGMVPDLLNQAWTAFRLQSFEEAGKDFQTAIKMLDRNPAGVATEVLAAQRLNATYGLGITYSLGFHGERTSEAKQLLQQVIDTDTTPTKSMAAWAELAIARDQAVPVSSDAAPDTVALQAAYQHILATYPDTAAAEEAFLYTEAINIQENNADKRIKAIAAIQDYLNAHPNCRFRSTLFDLQKNAYTYLHHYPEAFAAAEKAFATKEFDLANPNTTKAGDYYSLGLSAEFDLGDFATARGYFNRFLIENPDDQKAFVVRLELQRMDTIERRVRSGMPVEQAVQNSMTPLAPGAQDMIPPGSAPAPTPAGGPA